jgi:hypothetical protein
MKIRRSMTIDPEVWACTQAEAARRRVSASWLLEEVLREFLLTEKLANAPQRRKTRAPKQLEAAVDLAS